MATLFSTAFTGTFEQLLQSISMSNYVFGSQMVSVQGTFRTIGTAIYRASNDPSPPLYITNQQFGTDDYTVTSVLRQLTVEAVNVWRIIARYTDASNYYFAEYSLATADVRLWKRVAGVNTQIGTAYAWAPATATDYTWALSVNADQITVSLGGSAVIGPETDAALAPGTTANQIGVYLQSTDAFVQANGWRVDSLVATDFVTSTNLTYTEADMQYDTRARSGASLTGEVLILNTDGTPATGLVFNTSGLACNASTDNAAAASVSLVTMTVGTYAGGASNMGFVQINSTTRPGWYQIGYPTLPASGNRRVFTFTGTGLRAASVIVDLTADDTRAAGLTASDVLTAATAAPIAANIEQINTVPVTGNGGGTPFDV